MSKIESHIKTALKNSPALAADIGKSLTGAIWIKIAFSVLKYTYDVLISKSDKDRKEHAKALQALKVSDISDALRETGLPDELLSSQADMQIGIGNIEQHLVNCLAQLGKIADQQILVQKDIHGAIQASFPELSRELAGVLRAELAQIPLLIDASLRQTQIEAAVQFERDYLYEVARVLGRLEVLGLQVRDSHTYALDTAWIDLTLSSAGRWENLASDAVEDFLLANQLAAIRGAAGSGKTTMLQWVCCRCTTPSTDQQPNPWHGHIPFLLRLRRYQDQEDILPSRDEWTAATLPKWSRAAPPGWVDECLERGRAIILVDGVDEISAARREQLWRELDQDPFYYKNRVYVTSRNLSENAEFPLQWDPPAAMADAELRELSSSQVNDLIRKWHAAVKDELQDRNASAEEIARIADLGEPLIDRLNTDEYASMRSLATTPLMCAAICVVNRQNDGLAVESICELFEKCCEALVQKRDKARQIKPETEDELLLSKASTSDWMQLHSRLALKMLTNPPSDPTAGDSTRMEADKAEILTWLADDAQCYPSFRDFIVRRDGRLIGDKLTTGADALLTHMHERRGLIREVAGAYDFHHRSLRDYLAARAIPLVKAQKQLLNNVGDDRWREVIRLFPGTPLAGVNDGETLVNSLLTIARGWSMTKLRGIRAGMLALDCAPLCKGTVSDDFIDQVIEALQSKLQRLNFTAGDAESLAALGDSLLKHLELRAANLNSARKATSAARLLRRVDTTLAREIALKSLAKTKYWSTRRELEEWESVNPLQFDWIVKEISKLRFETRAPIKRICDLSPLVKLTQLGLLHLNQTAVSDLSPLAKLTQLEILYLNQTAVRDLSPLAELIQLRNLRLVQTGVCDLSPLAKLTKLIELHLNQTGVRDLSPLVELTQLRTVRLNQTGVSDLSPLAGLTQLQELHLNQTGVSDLSPLAGLTQLRFLNLNQTGVSDLSPLAGLTQLKFLHLNQTGISDLSPLAGLTNLSLLELRGTGVKDLTPLAGNRATVWIDEGANITIPGGLKVEFIA